MKMRDHRRRLYRVQRARVVPSRLCRIVRAGRLLAAAWRPPRREHRAGPDAREPHHFGAASTC
jgi:hypothetical protein